MEKAQAQALCLLLPPLVCLAGAGYAGLYQVDSGERSAVGYHNEDVQKDEGGVSEEVLDVLGEHKSELDSPKDLLSEDLEDFAEHGGEAAHPAHGSKSSSEVPQDSHAILAGFERQHSEHSDQPGPEHVNGLIQTHGHGQGHGQVQVLGEEPGHHDDQHEYEDLQKPEYAYRYGVHDPDTRDVKSAWELRDGDHTRGGYSLVEPDGHTRVVEYSVSKIGGFNALVKRYPP